MSDTKGYKETFYIVPRYIRKLPGMTLAFLDVYETIYQFWNKGLVCFLSNTAIMERTETKITQVKDAIAFFEKKGLLIRQKKGLKRFLIQPQNRIEFEQEAAPPAPSSDNNQVAAPAATGGRSSGHQVAAPAATEYKEVEYKELNLLREGGASLSPTPKKLDISHLLFENPHQLPEQMLIDWLGQRKSVTKTMWRRWNKELWECKQYGVTAIEVFEEAVSSNWKTIDATWFQERQMKKPKKNGLTALEVLRA